MSNEIVVTMQDVRALAKDAHVSHSFPIRNPEQAVMKIVAGRELGIPPVAALRGLDIIDGQIQMRAHLMAALIKASPKYRLKVLERTEESCSIEFFEREPEGFISLGVSTFNMRDAEQARLKDKDNWKKYPRRMLYARALSEGASTYCPDIFFGGIYGESEIEVQASPPIEVEPADPPLGNEEFRQLLTERCASLGVDKESVYQFIKREIRSDGSIYNLARGEQDAIARHVVEARDAMTHDLMELIEDVGTPELGPAIEATYGPIDQIKPADVDSILHMDNDALSELVARYAQEVPT